MINLTNTKAIASLFSGQFNRLFFALLLVLSSSNALFAQVTFEEPAAVCQGAGVQVDLGGGAPVGGVYSGVGVMDNGDGTTFTFDPLAVGVVVGNNTVNYTILPQQLGMDIDGEEEREEFGWSTSLSADGNRVAVGTFARNDFAGQVRLYDYNIGTNTWEQVGGNIDGESEGDRFGYSISLSPDGSRLAIGAPPTSIHVSGYASLYDYDGNTWEQVGDNINGEEVNDQFGSSVSLSSDGNRVVIGAPLGNDNTGLARLYDYNVGAASWIQFGEDINGEGSEDGFGGAVSLSYDGNRVAIGAQSANDETGQVRLFDYNTMANAWVQVGGDINGLG